MTTFSHAETHRTLRSLLLTADGLPPDSARAWENVQFDPTPGTPYVSESYVPATSTLLTTVTNGVVEYTGLYRVLYYGIAKRGPDAIHAATDAILAVFPAELSVLMPSGLALRIRGDVGPSAGQLIPQPNGFTVCPITIPWRVYT